MGAGLLAAIAGLTTPIIARILASVGFAVITVIGVQAAVNGLKGELLSKLGAAPLAGLQLAGLAGVWEALGYVLGAVAFTLALWGLTKAVQLTAK